MVSRIKGVEVFGMEIKARADLDTLRIIISRANLINCDTMVRGFIYNFIREYKKAYKDNKIALKTIANLKTKIKKIKFMGMD